MKTILCFFALLSGFGLVLSVISHFAALLGEEGPLGRYTPALHIGIFVVWLPAVLVASRLARNAPQRDIWRVLLRGCPAWMRYVTYGFFVYGIVNFVFFLSAAPKTNGSGPMPPQVVRGFSGHWMMFYSAAMAVLCSAAKLREEGWDRRCPNGHVVQPAAKFCARCGHPVSDPAF
jgi:hypothetical protein